MSASYPVDPIPTGPVQERPRGVQDADQQRTALLAELEAAGLELGDYDRRTVDWLAGWEWSTVATIASWVRRTAGDVR